MNTNKSVIILILFMIGWGGFGLSIAFFQFSENSSEIRKYPIPISKEYFASFETSYTPHEQGFVSEGYTGIVSVYGNITMKSSVFSADNPINVNIEIGPDLKNNPDYTNLVTALPDNYWVFFINADNYDNSKSTNRNIAIINLTKSHNGPKIIGNGTIIYNLGGNHPIYVVDPRELPQVPKTIMDRLGNYQFVFSFPKPLHSDKVVIVNYSGTAIESAGFSNPTSKLEPYYAEIKTSDALLTLESNKQSRFGIWLAITLAPITISIALRQPILRFLDGLNRSNKS